MLAGYFVGSLRRKLGLRQLVLETDMLEQLSRYDWPGNIRELEHLIGRAALRAKATAKSAIVSINAQGNWSAAAKGLKVGRANLVRLAKRLGVCVERRVCGSK